MASKKIDGNQLAGFEAPPRILILTGVLKGGGAERRLRYLVEYLSNAGVRIDLYVLTGDRNDPPKNVDCHFLGWRSEWDYGSAIRTIRRAIREKSPDVVLGWSSFMNLVCAAACLGLQPRPRLVLQECHEKASWWRVWRIKHIAVELISMILYRTADRIIFNSVSAPEKMARRYRIEQARMCCIGNPVAYERLAAEQRATPREYQTLTHPIVVYVGRLVGLKQVTLLFRAWLAIPVDRRPGLVYVGEGPERLKLEALCRKYRTGGRVLLAGFHDAPYSYIQYADLLVLPSRSEGLPNVVLEALALRTPVVSTPNCTMVRELSKAGGCLLCSADDPEDIARQMEEALRPETALRLRENGTRFVARFHPEKVLREQMNAIFQP